MAGKTTQLRSVTSALRALEVLAATDGSLGVTELADRLTVSTSTAHRLLATLAATGFARCESDRRYRVGPAVARLTGHGAPPPMLREAARPVLRWLAEVCGETIHLAVLEGAAVVTVDHVMGRRGGDAGHVVGARVPAHATAVGMALLAHRPEVVDAVVDAGLARWTARTITDPGVLRRQLADTRRRGYAINVGGWRDDTAGVAAAVVLRAGDVVAALGISGPASRVGRRSTTTALGPLARAGALALAARLAESPPSHPPGV
jgi:DNA-binding IclR family transcriptional regulator